MGSARLDAEGSMLNSRRYFTAIVIWGKSSHTIGTTTPTVAPAWELALFLGTFAII